MSDRAVMALDDPGKILGEYRKKLSGGEPLVGHVFLKWIYDNQYNPDRCRRVSVHARDDEGTDFAELDYMAGIDGFDMDDRKFLVTSLCCPVSAPVLNAVDSDWLQYRDAIRAAGVDIEFICGEVACSRGA